MRLCLQGLDRGKKIKIRMDSIDLKSLVSVNSHVCAYACIYMYVCKCISMSVCMFVYVYLSV